MTGLPTSIGGGLQIDVELGDLPETAVVVRFDAAVQVVVFDADVPFAVTIARAEPATAVAAAAAVVATCRVFRAIRVFAWDIPARTTPMITSRR